MAGSLNLQKYQQLDYRGLITDEHLHSLYMQKPQLISNAIKQLYETDLSMSYMNFVEKFPVETVEQENGFYEWMLQGQHERNYALTDAEDSAGNLSSDGSLSGTVGSNRAQFYLHFAEDFADIHDVLLGEQEFVKVLVQDKEPAGNGIKYRVEMLTDDVSNSIPVSEELFRGAKFSKDYNLTNSTLSHGGSRPSFSSPFRMQNRLSSLRMKYEVPGNMIEKGKNEPLEFNFMFPDGTQEKTWINYQDMMAKIQCDNMFARMLLYGQKNWGDDKQYLNVDEKTNFSIEAGEGLFNQIAPGSIHYYNSYDLDWHMEMLLDMGVGKIERGNRTITIGTGEFGAREIHSAIEAKGLNQTIIQQDPGIFRKGAPGNLGSANTFAYGGQWSEYQYVNGVRLKVEIIPFFDDDIRFKTRHPDGNRGLAESHRMIAFDYGGESGIKRVVPKSGSEAWGYIPGLRDPWSAGGKGKMKAIASEVDGYTVVMQKWGGIKVEDPTKIVDLRLNFTR
jgi:hypothetical protein